MVCWFLQSRGNPIRFVEESMIKRLIVGGPSKADLVEAFKYRFDHDSFAVTVGFKIKMDNGEHGWIKVRVSHLAYSGNSPNDLLVGGVVINPPREGYDKLLPSFYRVFDDATMRRGVAKFDKASQL